MSDIIAAIPVSSSRTRTNAQAQTTSSTSTRHSKTQSTKQQQHVMDRVTAEATCRKLVSVLALDAGFEGITASALDSLTRAFENYTQQMYSITHSYAELAGRTKPNVHDLEQAFMDMKMSPASLGSYVRKASYSKTPLLRGPLQETVAKGRKKKESNTALLDSDIEDNSDSEDEDNQDGQNASSTPGTKITARTIVPEHLPPFPSKHSYKQTPVFVKRPTDPQKIRELNAEQSRLVESNLKRLMAAENKVAMAAAHKDGSTATVAVAADLLSVKEEQQESAESIDRRALTKLETLPIVHYESSKRQQQLNASTREGGLHRYELQSGHHRGESSNSDLTSAGVAPGGNVMSNSKGEWRKERRRMRLEQQSILEEMEQNMTHKRIRQESAHGRLKLVTMDVDH
ncbi:hypothetical protein BGX28_009844 [Mortierella sp. GBA30]|nr:hypothetical protein BGX28_009844 [Mortierella sp. GBA30]